MRDHHDNNFTFLRFVAASMVIVAHAHDLLNDPNTKDPIFHAVGRSMGWIGVAIFFSMSGYLIMKSLDRSSDLGRFARARILRIFPGLAVCTLITVVALAFFSTLSLIDYFRNPQTFKFVAGNISLLSMQYKLPGVFQHNPLDTVNGSLWSLPYEAVCYVIAAALTGCGLLRAGSRRFITFGCGLALIVLYMAIHERLSPVGFTGRLTVFCRLDVCFLLGMAYAAFEHRFKLRLWLPLALAALAAFTHTTPLYDVTLSAALTAFVLWLAFVPSTILRRISRLPDYSYGIYIYAFPIQQVLLAEFPSLTPTVHAIVAFGLVLIPASLSWHFIEKPALRFKGSQSKKAENQAVTVAAERSRATTPTELSALNVER